MDAIRRIQEFSMSEIVLIAEANMGLESGHIADVASTRPWVHCLCESKNGRPGVLTTKQTKPAYKTRISDFLCTDGGIVFTEPFVSNTKGYKEARETLEEQLARMKDALIWHEGPTSEPTRVFSGKLNEDNRVSKLQRDDLAMSLGMLIYWGLLHRQGKTRRPAVAVRRTVLDGTNRQAYMEYKHS